jgi:adenylate cyclase
MTGQGQRGNDAVSAHAVRESLRRVLASGEFRASERLPRFLEFIVEETLAGRGGRLKGYVIGVAVFDKPSDFDPEHDSVVRVEAMRLRRALQTYYMGEGSLDPVAISIPKGSYQPVFAQRSPKASISGDPTNPGDTSSSAMPLAASVCLVLALIVFGIAGGVYWVHSKRSDPGVTGSLPSQLSALHNVVQLPSGPRIAVLPFSASGMADNIRIAQAFHAQLISDLTRFETLAVIGAESVSMYFGAVADLQPIAEKYDAQYLLTGILQSDGATLRLLAYLYDARERQYVWTTRFDRPFSPDSILKLQSELSAQVASAIGQIYGVINRAETRQLIGNPPRTMNAYQCVLGYYDYAAQKSEPAHRRTRECLESAVARDPDYAQAWSALGAVYLDEARLGYNRREEGPPPLERAEKAARTAVSLAPDHATGHRILAEILLDNGELRNATSHLRIALNRNPNDATLLASAGELFAKTGELDVAQKLVEKAQYLNPGHPPWYDGVQFAIAFQRRDYEEALRRALAYRRANTLHSHIALAATYGMLNDPAGASRALAALIDKFPDFPKRPRSLIAEWGYPEAFTEACLDGLRKAGLVNLF